MQRSEIDNMIAKKIESRYNDYLANLEDYIIKCIDTFDVTPQALDNGYMISFTYDIKLSLDAAEDIWLMKRIRDHYVSEGWQFGCFQKDGLIWPFLASNEKFFNEVFYIDRQDFKPFNLD